MFCKTPEGGGVGSLTVFVCFLAQQGTALGHAPQMGEDSRTLKLREIKLPHADTVAQISRGQKSAVFVRGNASQRCQLQFCGAGF